MTRQPELFASSRHIASWVSRSQITQPPPWIQTIVAAGSSGVYRRAADLAGGRRDPEVSSHDGDLGSVADELAHRRCLLARGVRAQLVERWKTRFLDLVEQGSGLRV